MLENIMKGHEVTWMDRIYGITECHEIWTYLYE